MVHKDTKISEIHCVCCELWYVYERNLKSFVVVSFISIDNFDVEAIFWISLIWDTNFIHLALKKASEIEVLFRTSAVESALSCFFLTNLPCSLLPVYSPYLLYFVFVRLLAKKEGREQMCSIGL